MRARVHIVVALLAFVGACYSASAIAMVGSFAASPGYSPERAHRNLAFWYAAFFTTTATFAVTAVLAYRARARSRASTRER